LFNECVVIGAGITFGWRAMESLLEIISRIFIGGEDRG